MKNGIVLSITIWNCPPPTKGDTNGSETEFYSHLIQAVAEVLSISPGNITIDSKCSIAKDHLNFESATVLVCCEWSKEWRGRLDGKTVQNCKWPEVWRRRLDDKMVRNVVFACIGRRCGQEYDPNSAAALKLRHAIPIEDFYKDPNLFLVTGRVCKPR